MEYDVTVSLVIINMHGDTHSISTNKDGSDPISAEELLSKYIEGIVLLNCNSGHLDSRYTNFAHEMLVRNNVEYVIAADGSVAGDIWAWTFHSSCKYSTYRSTEFYQANWSHPVLGHEYREPEGFIKYTVNDIGELVLEKLGSHLDLTKLCCLKAWRYK